MHSLDLTWPQAPKRTGPRSAAVLVRRMRASTQACGRSECRRPTAPSVARGTLGRGRLRSTRFRLASGETVRPVGTHYSHVQLPDFSVSHAAYRGSRAHCGGSHTEISSTTRVCETPHLAAGAGEDRAALSGHPRKANAGQYTGAMQQPATWPHSPERTGPRSAAVLVRRMRASKQARCNNAPPGRRRRRGLGRAQRPSS
jgi:hypothetical protein